VFTVYETMKVLTLLIWKSFRFLGLVLFNWMVKRVTVTMALS